MLLPGVKGGYAGATVLLYLQSMTEGIFLGDPRTAGLMVLFWSVSRIDTKSLERASMDYEAPLMPCGCILFPASTELAAGMPHRESEAKEGSAGHSNSMGPICPLGDWGKGSS